MDKRAILVVEDNPTDEALFLRALNKAGITNPIVTVKDGLEAVQYLFATGRHEFRNPKSIMQTGEIQKPSRVSDVEFRISKETP